MQNNNVPPDSEEGQLLAKDFGEMIMEFTAGDMSMISRLMETANANKKCYGKWAKASD